MNKRIMIVDDEPDVLFALRTIFERKNFDVITVKNGFECLNELEKGFKGVILMDIMMPDMDGWDTIKTIVQRGLMKGVAIEIITGKGTKDHEKMAGLESYIRDYLAKPLDTEQLLASVDECNRYLDGKK
ncbi:MAG: response regulator [Candidatus Thermoplasmatota archaeon]|nr:response regulator [Candidatus Thermoplasmatota archaeon]